MGKLDSFIKDKDTERILNSLPKGQKSGFIRAAIKHFYPIYNKLRRKKT